MSEHEPPVLPYQCPRTGQQLQRVGDSLRSSDGTKVYRLREGIPHFECFEPAEDSEMLALLERLNTLASNEGWKSALEQVFGEEAPMVRYVTRREFFVDLLPLDQDSDVLEIGPGLGQFTPLLARRAKQVWALEVVAGQAVFAAQRCRQLGLGNVNFAVGGDDCRLPYVSEFFDAVVLNLVFEWWAGGCENEPFPNCQRRLLAEMYRVLRPGGCLYLSTKNRFALRFLIGKPDEHYHNLRFGSALPRWLANLLVRRRGHRRGNGYLYSYNELADMLRRVGFAQLDSFWAVPEMRYPSRYIPTDPKAIKVARRRRLAQGEMRSTRFLMRMVPAPWVKFVTPGLAFRAKKPR